MYILCIIEKTRSDSLCFHPTFKSLEVVKLSNEPNKTYDIIFEDDIDGVLSCDFSKMLLKDVSITKLDTWYQLEDYMSTTLALKYKTVPVIPHQMFTLQNSKLEILPSPVVPYYTDGDIWINAPRTEINFNDSALYPVPDEDEGGVVETTPDGSGVSLYASSWQFIEIDYLVTPNSRLEFDFKSTEIGEIHAIGLWNEMNPYNQQSSTFMVYGEQLDTGMRMDFRNYQNSGVSKHYNIPIGSFMTGKKNYLVLICDNDAAVVKGNSTFTNIILTETVFPRKDVNFDNKTPVGYGDDSVNGTVEAVGKKITLTGDKWQLIEFNYTLNSSTRLEFDFRSTVEGGLHGIAVLPVGADEPYRMFKVFGNAMAPSTVYSTYDKYVDNGVLQHFSIPVGQFFTGPHTHLGFVMSDPVNTAGVSEFSNIALRDIPLRESSAVNHIKRPKIISVTHTTGVEMDYGTIHDPTLRNHPFLRYKSEEVVFKHTGITPVVDFSNCIPIVNGRVHYPVVHDNELYAVGGTQAIKAADNANIGTLLIDFTPIGDIDVVRMCECTTIDNPYGYVYQLPDGKTLKDKCFFLVIGNRLILSAECRQINNTTISINPYNININNIRLSNKIIDGYYIRGTKNVKVLESVDDFMLGMSNDNDYNNFIIIVDNPKLRYHMLLNLSDINTRILKFPENVGGILMKKMTREIVDYCREHDSDATMTYLPETKRCSRLVNDSEDNLMEVAFSGSYPSTFEHVVNDNDNGFVMIDVMVVE